MKIILPQLSFNEKLDEFDFWITPSLGDITNSSRYKEVQSLICTLIDIIGEATNQFEKFEGFTPGKIGQSIVNHVNVISPEERVSKISALATFLFLVTGKSDNNCKCQFPLFLRDVSRVSAFPKVNSIKGNKTLAETEIPREIKSDRMAKLVSDLNGFPQKQLEILTQYISFIVDSYQYLRSFWSIGRTYFEMKKVGFEKDFLQPLIVFQVRGSVSASGGHEPEDSLRDRMIEWGLIPNIDFNNSDIIITDAASKAVVPDTMTATETEITVEVPIEEDDSPLEIVEKVEEVIKNKTRAYDFVLPFNVEGWNQKVFIQCQFYAGDSGSVSHKNVDQIRTSREFVKTKRADPIFLEYIDGAGYFSSLWGDLKKILAMQDTNDFFQVRTAVIKLRSKLQELGFLTPLEVVHAWALKNGSLAEIVEYLLADGYAENEIQRVLKRPSFTVNEDQLEVNSEIIDLSRKYLLLDFIAVKGQAFSESSKITGALLVPAFGKYFGIRMEDITGNIISEAGKFKEEWIQSGQLLKDIQFLTDNGWVVQR
ncbi:MAG: hypothetical protein JWR09_870 [Mucilaginibacter sp.]|nr:hypothetical protein [Mucilaginibacter sp.]